MPLTKTQVAMLEASGTPDNTTFLRGDGAWGVPAGTSSGGFSSWQIFTSSGTFTVPAGITKVKVTVTGGGASGSGGYTICFPVTATGQGGGGGGTAIKIISGLTSGSTVAVTVGAGGAARTGTGINQVDGNAGATSSFGAFCSATGGGVNGGVGVGSGGDINLFGGTHVAGNNGLGTAGGGSFFAQPTSSVGEQVNGLAGRLYGGGGSGGGANPYAANMTTGAGAAGVVIVEY